MALSRVGQHRVLKEEEEGEGIKSWNSVRARPWEEAGSTERGLSFGKRLAVIAVCWSLPTAPAPVWAAGCLWGFLSHGTVAGPSGS